MRTEKSPPPLRALQAHNPVGLDRGMEPRWHAAVAILATALIYFALPSTIALGPKWLPFALTVPLEAVTMLARKVGRHTVNRVMGYLVSGILTAFVMASVCLLIMGIVNHSEESGPLLKSALMLWVSNILIFAIWYWRLDAGGPNARDKNACHTDGAFLFPQMQYQIAGTAWSPQFIDYLFIAFNTATAFSPTDVPILSRWAKILVMLQSIISLSIVLLLAGRAVNIM